MPIPSGFKTKEEWNAYQRQYRKSHKYPANITKILTRAIEIKIAFDLPDEECVKRAFEEVKTE